MFVLSTVYEAVASSTAMIPAVTSVSGPETCLRQNVFKRSQTTPLAPKSCAYGACGTTCLSQGAFCCGPAGTKAVDPMWVCDNGACITSIRGALGVVDCYDPDNPAGTTQSCIDNVPTTTCSSTDRCYTCDTDVPFCHWQTYVEPSAATLRWFSCVSSRVPDETFYASSIVNVSDAPSTPVLTLGAIIGIAVGGGVALIVSASILAWCYFRKRKDPPPSNQPEPPMQYGKHGGWPLPMHPTGSYVHQPPPTPHELGVEAPPKIEAASTPVYELPVTEQPMYDVQGFLLNEQDHQHQPRQQALSPVSSHSAQETLVSSIAQEHPPNLPTAYGRQGSHASGVSLPPEEARYYSSRSPHASPAIPGGGSAYATPLQSPQNDDLYAQSDEYFPPVPAVGQQQNRGRSPSSGQGHYVPDPSSRYYGNRRRSDNSNRGGY